jgi:hypothetical protein
MVMMVQSASAHPYQTTLFMRFDDGTIEGEVIARGSREECERAKLNPPPARPAQGKRIMKTWVEVMRAPTARGQE